MIPPGDAAAAEAKFRALLEAAPDAIIVVNDGGRIVLVNPQTDLLFGYMRAELLDERVEMLVPARVRSVHTAHRHGYVQLRARAQSTPGALPAAPPADVPR